jgi:peptidoglycan/xylan/chitin deacetylase (PgdA/CDA1 family)
MLRILAYHQVAELKDARTGDPSISATPACFAEQMRHVAKHYQAIAMPELLDAIEINVPLPERAVLITFDDAYADFAEIAWPILKQFRLPATVFVPTAYPDHPELTFWWQRLYRAFVNTSRTLLAETPLGPLPLATPDQRQRSLRALIDHVPAIPHEAAMKMVDAVCAQLDEKPANSPSALSWDQLRQLAKEGLTLGSHTRNHPILTQISPLQIREEIRSSQQDLRREIGFALPIFCYPHGDHSDIVSSILRSEGISLAFTTLSGENRLDSADFLRLRRTCVWPRTSMPLFRFRLNRLGLHFDAWRQQWERHLAMHKLPQIESGLD